MEHIPRLKTLLLAVANGATSPNLEENVFNALNASKPQLLRLLDVGPRNAQEKKELEAGRIYIKGAQRALNREFVQQALYLAQELDCSEAYVTDILWEVQKEYHNDDPLRWLELSVAVFHRRRRDLAHCLELLFDLVKTSGDNWISLRLWTQNELMNHPSAGSFPARVMKELETVTNLIARTEATRRNARSNTMMPTAGTSFTFGADVLTARIDSLKSERRTMALVLCAVLANDFFASSDIKMVIDWLADRPNDPLTYYMLTALFTVLEPIDPDVGIGTIRDSLPRDASLVSHVSKKLAATTTWKDNGLKGAVLLKWTLFLTDARHLDEKLEQSPGLTADELESQTYSAIYAGAFQFLTCVMLHLERRQTPSTRGFDLSQAQLDQREVPPEAFKPLTYATFQSLVRSTISYASPVIRRIKQRQEDRGLARGDRQRAAEEQRNDIPTLFAFIGQLYSALPPDSALPFWGSAPLSATLTYHEQQEMETGKLPNFLQFAVWQTPIPAVGQTSMPAVGQAPQADASMAIALYDMLSGLAHGRQCSELAYNFMARATGDVVAGGMLASGSSGGQGVSWAAIFSAIEYWVNQGPPRTTQAQSLIAGPSFLGQSSMYQSQVAQPPPKPIGITLSEVLLAQAFLRFTATVVRHSVAVRETLARHAIYHGRYAIQDMVVLITLAVPLELKAALFETLAAFGEPGAGRQGVEICMAIWTAMEKEQVIDVRGSIGSMGIPVPPTKGVEVELEEIEMPNKVFPETTAFLRLLTTLVHTPKRLSVRGQALDSESLNTVPAGLGQPYRHPGAGPYVRFVVDTVFANVHAREYRNPADRWEINDLCLCFIERHLASFAPEKLVEVSEDAQALRQVAEALVVHPGYELVVRLLSETPLRGTILQYTVDGVDGMAGDLGQEPFFCTSLIRVVRIIQRVLEIQDVFLDVLVPLLADVGDLSKVSAHVHPRSYYTRFDQALSFNTAYVPSLARCMAVPQYGELVLLALKTLSSLASSHYLPNLATLIERSHESEEILAGLVQILRSDSMQDVQEAEDYATQGTGAGAADPLTDSSSLEQAIRLAALDFFIENTKADRKFPNVAHLFLLGPLTTSRKIVEDAHALGAQTTCFHVILELVSDAIPKVADKGKAPAAIEYMPSVDDATKAPQLTGTPLFMALPGLAEKCYRVLLNLCQHQRTSDVTMRYLRSHERFFARQLAAMRNYVPVSAQEASVSIQYPDGTTIRTTVHELSAFLRVRSIVFDLAALDVHDVVAKGRISAATRTLEVLFGNDTEVAHDVWGLHPFHDIGQTNIRVVEFVQSLAFEIFDHLQVEPVKLEFLAELDLASCFRKDAHGCDIVDRAALVTLLTTAKAILWAKGAIADDRDKEKLGKEVFYIMESCALENHRREISHAMANAYAAWARLLNIVLHRCFSRLSSDRRESALFELMHVLPPIAASPALQEPTAVVLSETILTCIVKLRENRHNQAMFDMDALPPERLLSICRSILECIVNSGHIELVRGNLYAALVNYLHLAQPQRGAPMPSEPQITMSLLSSVATREAAAAARKWSWGPVALVKTIVDRLIAIISRDAISGMEVWKTVAFILLDSLQGLSKVDKQQAILAAVSRHGILANFVQGLKESDVLLQGVLKPDPDDLNPLYVYEAKMSLFTQMALTRQGAERLLESRLVSILTECDYLDARPESDQAFMDHNSFLPSAIHRYHQLFMPALQVLNAMLATLGGKHATAANAVLDFITTHNATIVILIKTDIASLPLSVLDELHLIVSLCTHVLTYVPKEQLASPNTAFGALHAAILNLASRCICTSRWTKFVTPQTDTEVQWSEVHGSGLAPRSKFDDSVQRKSQLLRHALTSYLGVASDFTEQELSLVLSPLTAQPRSDEQASQFSASLPTLGDALQTLNELCGEVQEAFMQLRYVAAELASPETVRVDNVEEIVRDVDPKVLRNLEIGRKRALICREYERIQDTLRDDAKLLLTTTEMLLLLLWRHITHYVEHPAASQSQLRASLAQSMRFLSMPKTEDLRMDIQGKLTPMLQRLDGLNTLFPPGWQANQMYIGIIVTRLQGVVEAPPAE
ncbi:nucleoporin Nup186/Nup192/Nup205 [Schizophyllum amplum]|uniref:Nucleoporin Nup186/Nup192/Nup205 n=1 Tax=Schizophyllum amplum TaxID=97359 RepID=A0A550C5I5_9AGAR|nr:nucleoporin Nup186/Nup192/Nup205 [Auriculariopsis ampla]